MAVSVAFFLASLVAISCRAADEPKPDKGLVGGRADIQLRSGKTLKDVIVEELKPGKIEGTFAQVRITNPAIGSKLTLSAASVTAVTPSDGTPGLAFDEATKSLAPTGDRLSAIHKAAGVADAGKSSAAGDSTRKTGRSKGHSNRSGSSKKPEDPAVSEAERKEREKKRVEHFQKTGVWLWPEVVDEMQEKGLAEHKELLRKTAEKFPSLNMQLYETKHFLFFTDMPRQAAEPYIACLDSLQNQLSKAFAVKDKDSVWIGKLPVVAFVRREPFEAFEQEFFKLTVNGQVTQGLAHKSTTGDVIISCHCGSDPYYFAAVLVHETTHGFVHRYHSAKQLPSWLEEGIADWSAMNVVQNKTAVLRKVRNSVEQVKKRGSLGGNFFTAEHIEPWQYGAATSMVDFMLKSDGKAFRKLIDLIKSGTAWEEALKQTYKVTPAELAAAFGRSTGIPNLQP